MRQIAAPSSGLPVGPRYCRGTLGDSVLEAAKRMIGQALVILDQIEATSRELIGQGGEVPSRKAKGFEHAADQGPVMSSN